MIFLRSVSSILKSGKFNRFSVILPKAIGTISEKQDENLSEPINATKKVTKEKFSNSAEYHEMRCRQMHQFKKGGGNPYPHDFQITISLEDFINKYANNLEKGLAFKHDIVSVSGRIITIRKSSSKLIFYVLRERKVHLQIIADATSYFSKEEFLEITDIIKRGDVIGIKGYPFRSNSGELSILAINMQIIAPCLRPIPVPYYGLKNNKTRFKERYVDLFMNLSSQEALIIHSNIRTFLRNYLAFHKFF
ncbi:lysine--tRNA ligase [Trichonephila clavata]|uniref:Lysine--tRNA ligase n=1 Tax=Trichonephila clavata TaxID=2740835 RepID=A0A8X6HC63_TRICU|nr:lysine--tRNA ligase [Trichonephila clavata]